VIFLYLHIGKHLHGWMNGKNSIKLLSIFRFIFLRYGMTIDQVREYERDMFERTNKKVLQSPPLPTNNTTFD
jgi:hypothetical protein